MDGGGHDGRASSHPIDELGPTARAGRPWSVGHGCAMPLPVVERKQNIKIKRN
jgi:hypothetical protein